jgi:hypothetical protein
VLVADWFKVGSRASERLYLPLKVPMVSSALMTAAEVGSTFAPGPFVNPQDVVPTPLILVRPSSGQHGKLLMLHRDPQLQDLAQPGMPVTW